MHDLPSQTLLQQSSACPKSGEELEVLGKQASAVYRCGGLSLNDAVVETVKKAGLSPEQVKRVCEFANTDAYLKDFEKKGSTHKYIAFEGGPANPSEVLKDLNNGGGGTIFDDGSDDYSHGPMQLQKSSAALLSSNREAMGLEKTAVDAWDAAQYGAGALVPGAIGYQVGGVPGAAVGTGLGVAGAHGLNKLLSRKKKKGKKEEKTASLNFNPTETAFEQMWDSEPLADAIDMKEKLAAADDEMRSELNSTETLFAQASEDLYQLVKQAAEIVPLGHVLQVWEEIVPGPGFVKSAFSLIGPRLVREGVFSALDEMGGSLEKVASRGLTVNMDHPLVSTFAAYCESLEKMACLRQARKEVGAELGYINNFLKVAAGGKLEAMRAAGGLIPKAWKGATRFASEKAAPAAEKFVGAVGGEAAGKAAKGAVTYAPHAAVGLAGLEAYDRGVKHGPLSGLGTFAKARIPGTQQYYMRQMALSQNPGLF